jgi:NAD(P)-dependent dehydrogenase (short-subunit alcohol dehydrogenase family)
MAFVSTASLPVSLLHSPNIKSLSNKNPGYMDTALNNVPALDAQKKIWKSLTPQKRLGAVDDLNGLAVLLASDASAFMTGSNVIIDGGYTLY